jgi:hypothetical protein
MALGALVDAWLAMSGPALKAGTLARLQQGKRPLLDHFQADRALGSITEG